ncbi:sugar ABC transporter ATP-binding protein [Murimonas intestini]|nr:sugar ABC transporter ATP-binding protein [Murimonas intestini]MCR1841546.1 sugar ABC transporter ATP-binding protein [Murimonas intestini]MCR1867052.1 sugar ABC transporter ATP-binding protein [Murimonas intestini]MCR1884075.1 sugar ABC transporter ATP-binding protein [Murimonas intestini]
MYKSFGITKALKGVGIELRRGQILGLIGENGSGKSTLTSIVAAIQPADSGKMYLEGQPYEPSDTMEANEKGICMILQEKGTFDALTVAKNIFVGKENLFCKKGILDNRAMNRAAQEALDAVGADYIRASMPLGALNFEDRKLVEVARAMYMKPKILIVDETTTALSRNGRDILYEIMKKMKKEGKSVIFISHDIDELMEICDTLTILRDGVYIDTLEKEKFDAGMIRKLMVGREVAENYYRSDCESSKNKEVVLSMDHVSARELKDITFELHKGEILGFGGLADCGMHILGSVAFGNIEPDLGRVLAGDGSIIASPRDAMGRKIAYISKNRDQESLMVASSIRDNICCASYNKLSQGPFLWPKAQDAFVDRWAGELEIKMQGLYQYVMELSGGNKQKVALAKWLGFGADIFILDCPTRGIDIGVKSNIYALMEELRSQGKSIILISEELPEVIGMSDRTIILKDGRISGEFKREDGLTETLLIDYMV